MGTWGTLPNQNDAAHDLLSAHAWGPLNAGLRSMLDMPLRSNASGDAWGRVGAVYEAATLRAGAEMTHPLDVTRNVAQLDPVLVREALELLPRLERDEEWIASWVDPAKARESIGHVRSFFEKWLEVHG